jgi:5-methylthioadenosine/S-adenosylhomocysteine deaminase
MKKTTIISGQFKLQDKLKNGYVVIDNLTGIIKDFNLSGDVPENIDQNILSYGSEYLIECGDFNCHSHPEQSLYKNIVNKNWDLSTWCKSTIYKYSPFLEPSHIYYGCLSAFKAMLLNGITSVMVSFYCHNNGHNINDQQVIKAAEDVGIRLYFGRMNYDIVDENSYENKILSQKSYFESVEEYTNNYMSLLDTIKNDNIVIAPAVHSLHGSSKESIINAINLGNKYSKLVQIHLSEDKNDVSLCLNKYGVRPVEFLVDLYKNNYIGSLKNLILSDCIWLNEKEIELIYKYNMKIVLNPRMNKKMGVGTSNIPYILKLGISPYLGTDGEASNYSLSIDEEKAFLKNSYKDIPEDIIDMLGKDAIEFNNGCIEDIGIGAFCDLKVIKNNKVRDVFVSGKKVVEDGKLLNMDIENDIEAALEKSLQELNGKLNMK